MFSTIVEMGFILYRVENDTTMSKIKNNRVLIACEFSNIVRDEFIDAGYDAISCDFREAENGQPHIQGDVTPLLSEQWDLMIAHPPCTYLCNSGVRWLYEKDGRWQKMIEGALFFRQLLKADIPHIAIENPIMHSYSKDIIGRGPDQTIQPWQFGEPEKKAICLWLKNLPELEPTNVVDKREPKVHEMPPSDDRSKERSRFYPGIAKAMVDQWASVI